LAKLTKNSNKNTSRVVNSCKLQTQRRKLEPLEDVTTALILWLLTVSEILPSVTVLMSRTECRTFLHTGQQRTFPPTCCHVFSSQSVAALKLDSAAAAAGAGYGNAEIARPSKLCGLDNTRPSSTGGHRET